MDNINRKIRNRTEIKNYIIRIDIEPEGNEYKNVGRKIAEKETGIERLVQYNIQEQKREDMITSRADRQIRFQQILD
ncbi:MAG: hypothetical protein EZS28_028154 [Streblomastix strix]|uniref:Uncharacterized protein n=1 Tax=Streblomastix strix TaxID=222440 RepID=A0A5J4V0U5_9EUKA|nr:MAG: hypothetical protein EZS28_028154 [Streblomastix strix]